MLSKIMWIRDGALARFSHYLLPMLLAVALALCMAPAQAIEYITYYHNDTLGSPIAATDENGEELWNENYRPFGERVVQDSKAGSNPLWYTGKPQDSATGLSYYGARYYDPVLGRFMGIDPVGFQDGNLYSFNRFSYANNNPYKFVDPDGEAVVIAFLILVAVEIAFDTIFAPDVAFDSGVAQTSITFTPGPLKTLKGVGRVTNGAFKQFGRSIDDLSGAASQPFKNTGLTKAARALDKHAAGQRSSGTFPRLSGNAAARNKQAQKIVDDILGNSKSEIKTLRRGGLEVRSPSGQGIRFNKNGSFSGFVD